MNAGRVRYCNRRPASFFFFKQTRPLRFLFYNYIQSEKTEGLRVFGKVNKLQFLDKHISSSPHKGILMTSNFSTELDSNVLHERT